MSVLLPLTTATLAAGPASEVVRAAVPTDPASIFVYLLVAASGYMIWRGSRTRSGGPRD